MKKPLLILGCVSLLALCSCAKDEEEGPGVTIYRWDGADDEVVLTNAALELRFSPLTGDIVLTEKATGVQWTSTPDGAAADTTADALRKNYLRSQVVVEYTDETGVPATLDSYRYSILKGNYEYAVVDGGLEVNYTIGDIDRIYIFPPAISEARMTAYLDQMTASDKSKVKGSYRLYDLTKLLPMDDKNALLNAYPDLEEENIYVILADRPDYMKEQLETIFSGLGYTMEDYDADNERYGSMEGAVKPVFNVTLRYELDGNSLVTTVPFEKLGYRAATPMTQLLLLPYFGAGGLNDEGYLFVPDGSGALINFNNGRASQNSYNVNVYGWDYAMTRDAVVTDNHAAFPVFGIQKNGAAMVCVIEEGASYARINADVAGRYCAFNNVAAQYAIVHGEFMNITGRSQRGVYVFEPDFPADERIVARYTVCAEDTYTGMAKEYRAWLRKKYPSLGTAVEANSVPVAVEIIGAVSKIQHRLGIPFLLPLKLTSYAEAADMVTDIAGRGWAGARIKLLGAFSGGYYHAPPSSASLIDDLGGKKDFARLLSAAEAGSYQVYAEADFVFVRRDGLFDSFNPSQDTARYANQQRAELLPYNFVWFDKDPSGSKSYLARPGYTTEAIAAFAGSAAKLGVSGVAFRSVGSSLGADYRENRTVSREASMNMQSAALARLKEAGSGVMVNTGYAYSVPYADIVTSIDVADQSFGITDVSVPFYEIALHGLVPYTGRAINLAGDYTDNILRSVEGGAGLYFSFMAASNAVLQETDFTQFYSNEYVKWIADADSLYQAFTRDFGRLAKQTIEGHEILADKVTVTRYQDGTRVVVNRGKTAYVYNGVIVPGSGYKVIR